MEQVEVNVFTLDDNKKYEVLDRIVMDNNNYYFLVNEQDENDCCIKKQIIKDGKEYLQSLEEEEFNKVINIFTNKFKGKG